MSDRKNHNSLIFLTTLGVYLGLVLVGSSPAVLAQAATTRSFDIKSEIVVEDDLDKKPDDDLFVGPVEKLVRDFDRLGKEGIFDWGDNEFRIDSLIFCESVGSPAFLSSGSWHELTRDRIESASLTVARGAARAKSNTTSASYFDQDLDAKLVVANGGINLDLAFGNHSGDEAQQTAAAKFFHQYLIDHLTKAGSEKTRKASRIIAAASQVSVKDGKVFVVTRLPRASIDELLTR